MPGRRCGEPEAERHRQCRREQFLDSRNRWLIAGAGYAAVYQGTLFLFAGLLVYVWLATRKKEVVTAATE